MLLIVTEVIIIMYDCYGYYDHYRHAIAWQPPWRLIHYMLIYVCAVSYVDI